MSLNQKLPGVLLLLAGCASRSPVMSPGSQPTNSPATTPSVSSGRSSWVISPTEEQHDYISATSTRLELVSDTGALLDTLASRISFTLSISRNDDGTYFSGTLTSLSTQAGIRVGSSNQPLSVPLHFSGHFSDGKLAFDSLSPETITEHHDCSKPSYPRLAAIGHALVLPPIRIHRGADWSDSLSMSSCAGLVPITLTIERTYHVVGESTLGAASTILIERRNQTHFTGEGVQEQHWTTIRGDGTGLAQLQLDVTTGILLQLQGEDTTAISIISSGRDQKFSQVVRETVSRIR
jgi:hypothetical protein